MKTKIYCTLIILTILLLLPWTVSANFIDIDENPYKNEIETLHHLGLIEGKDVSTFLPDDKINRAEIAVIIAKVMGYKDMEDNEVGESKFSDVSATHWAANSIHFLNDLKVMQGYTDGRFGVDDLITGEQLLHIMLRITGYEPMLQVKSLYEIAAQTDMTKGIKGIGKDELTRAQAAKIIYNGLFVNLLKTSTYDNESIIVEEGNSFLEEKMKLMKIEGIVTANPVTRLASPVKAGKNTIEIDRVPYSMGDITQSSFIGYYVDAYIDISDDKGIVKYMAKNERGYEETVISSEDLLSISVTESDITIVYTTDSKEFVKTISVESNVLYNGVALEEYDEYLFDVAMGTIHIIEYKNGGCTLSIFSYTNYVVGSVNVNEEIIIDKLTGEIIDLDSKKYDIDIYKYGIKVHIDNINDGDVLSLFKSKGSYILVQISDEVIYGTINEISDTTVLINGNLYDVAKGLDLKDYLGYQGELYFDYTGKLAALNYSKDESLQYGYLIKLGGNIKGFSKHLTFKILTVDNVIKEFEGSENMKINDEAVLKKDTLDLSLFIDANGNPKGQLVKYSVSVDDKITSLYTADVVERGPKSFLGDFTSYGYRKNSTAFFKNNKVCFYISAETPVFMVPPEYSEKDSDYTVIKLNYYKDLGSYNCKPYDASEYRLAKAVVIAQLPKVDMWGRMLMVERIGEALNEDGDTVKMIYGYYLGKEIRYPLQDERATVLPGDIARVSVINDVIHTITVDANVNQLGDMEAVDDYHNDFATGIIEGVSDSIVSIRYASGISFTFKVNKSSHIYIYDMETEKFRIGDVNDLVKGKKIFVKVSTGLAHEIVIVK